MKPLLSLTALGCTVTLACGGAATTAAPANTPAAPSGRSRIDCPVEPALTALARQHFSADRGDVGVSCVAIYRDGPRWLLDGWHDPGDAEGVAFVQAYVDAASGAALWTTGAGEFDFPSGAIDRISADEWTAVDLDSDGKDELVHVSGTSAQGYDAQSLDVLAITDSGLASAGTVSYLEDNTAADDDPAATVSCRSTWKLVAGPGGAKALELTVVSDGAVAGGCLSPGRHVFTWSGTALTELP